jgi:hypothetical protein
MKKFFSFGKQRHEEVRNIFSKYIPKDTLDNIIEGKHNMMEPNHKKGLINFIIIQLKEEPIEELHNLHKPVVSTILENKGFIAGIISTIIFATFGFPFQDDKNSANLNEQTAFSLLKNLGNNIKVVYGSDEGFYGNVGNSKYHNYSPLIHEFNKKLDFLINLEYGKIMKV